MAASIPCPYCLGEIPKGASVCRHCAREVDQLRSARAEIGALRKRVAELEAALARQPQTVPQPAPVRWVDRLPSWGAGAVLWSFYLLSLLATGLPVGSEYQYQFLLLGLAVVAGVLLVMADGATNVWLLFLYGCAQPAILALAFTLIGMSSPGDLAVGGVGLDFMILSAQVGTAMAAGGIGGMLLGVRAEPWGTFVSPQALVTLMDRTEQGIGRVNKLFAAAAGLLALLSPLLSRLLLGAS